MDDLQTAHIRLEVLKLAASRSSGGSIYNQIAAHQPTTTEVVAAAKEMADFVLGISTSSAKS